MPGHANGKAAAEPCANLSSDLRCRLWAQVERPSCCAGLKPSDEMCGDNRQQALAWLSALELASRP